MPHAKRVRAFFVKVARYGALEEPTSVLLYLTGQTKAEDDAVESLWSYLLYYNMYDLTAELAETRIAKGRASRETWHALLSVVLLAPHRTTIFAE